MSSSSSSKSHDSSSDDEKDHKLIEAVYLGANLVAQHIQMNFSKQQKHTSNYTGGMWIRDILEGHPCLCHDMFRMEKKVFLLLCNTLKINYDITNSKKMNVEEMLGVFLYTLGHGAVNRNSQSRFSRSGETISRRFRYILKGVLQMSMDMIKPLDREYHTIHPKILHDKRYFPFFRDCIGAIDGTHIKCIVPASSMTRYIGRKGFTTQNILAITDWDMCFTYVWAGWEGTAHDSRIFHEARTTPSLNFPHPPQGKYYLVDSGYPMPMGYIAPYKKERYHIPDFRHDRTIRNSNELFNYYHSSLRCTVERTFGVWKNRFRLLQNMTSFSFEMQRDIVVASMTIHNFIRRNTTTDADFMEYELNEDLNPEENNIRNVPSTSTEAEEFHLNQTCSEMLAVRDSIRDELITHHF